MFGHKYTHLLENEKRLLAVFKELGITSVHVYFDGSGDSGQIDGIDIEGAENELLKAVTVTLTVDAGRDFDQKKKMWVERGFIERTLPLEAAIEEHVYEHLMHTHIDWYNNEGGFGEWGWTIDGGLNFDVNARFTEFTCLHSEGRPLGEEEEVE